MIKSDTPRLCGGTFFVLLLRARIPRSKCNDSYVRKGDSFTDPDMLETLIRVMDPDFIKPPESSFKNNTSQYKSCKKSNNTYLPFDNEILIKAFDHRVKHNYSEPLLAMANFISTFISVQHEIKCTWLVKALLELIETDDSIDAEAPFHILENGKAVTKNEISTLTDICLQSFILGIWHFIVVNRPNNEIGQGTFAQWHEAPDTKGQSHTFISNIGDSITRPINAKMLNVNETDTEPEPEVIIDDGYEHTNTTEEPFSGNPAGNTINQTINNPIVFNQSGNNSVQIGSINTLTINH